MEPGADQYARCLEEIESVMRKDNSEDTDISLGPDELPYVKAVIMETLRLYPPAPVTSRTLEKSIHLPPLDGEEQLPQQFLNEGQMVMMPIWSIQRDPHNFSRPTEMLPARWVHEKAVNDSWLNRASQNLLSSVA